MKTKILLSFPQNKTEQPITYNLIKRFDLQINILRASIGYNVEGRLLLEVTGDEEKINDGIDYLHEQGIGVDYFARRITRDETKCVDCGACAAACSGGALSFDTETWKMTFDEAKCFACGLCVEACPLRIIEITL